MNVSSAASAPITPPVQSTSARPATPPQQAPVDADGDHDGTTAAQVAARSSSGSLGKNVNITA